MASPADIFTMTMSTPFLSDNEQSHVVPDHFFSEFDYDENNFSGYDDYDYGSDYGDDLDIRLTLPAPHKAPRARRNKQNKKSPTSPKPAPFTKIIQPIVDCSQPLLFPLEVLELVCLHLNQATLRHCMSLVCKSWNTVSDRYIRRIGIWTSTSDHYEQRLLQQMPGLDTLECWIGINPDVAEMERAPLLRGQMGSAWERFRDAILAPLQDPPLQDNKDDSSNRTCLLHYIQHLTLRGDRMNYVDPLPTIQHEFRFLKTLTILNMTRDLNIYLFRLLNCSPELRELTIKTKSFDDMHIYFGDEDDDVVEPPEPVFDPETAHFPVKPKVILPIKNYPDRYRLQVFECSAVMIKQRVLERVISTCPELQILKAIEINRSTWHPAENRSRPYVVDEARLFEHAKSSCPNLEWMTILKVQNCVGEAYMKRQNLFFPESKYLMLTSNRNELELLTIPAVATLVQNITVLEIRTTMSVAFDSLTLNKLLCRMPHLLHLHAFGARLRVNDLHQPPKPVIEAPKRFIWHNKYRKQVQKTEKQRRRREALSRFQNSTSDENDESIVSLPEPLIWQCRDLRTLELGLYPYGEISLINKTWAEYVDRNRLFRNLTSLRLQGATLHLGQLREFPHVTKQRAKALEELKARRSKQGLAQIRAERDIEKPLRYCNDLLPLRGMRSLEEFNLCVDKIPGMLHPRDLDFLRQRSVETVVGIISHEHDNDTVQIGDPQQGGKSIGDDTSDSDDSSSDDHSLQQEEETETFWPRLQAFHIRYTSHLQGVTNFTGVVAGMRAIRPAVEFSIRR
ncbi:hypothetical protein BGZ99_000680, partial [Dissophora globulifera]